MKQAKKESPVSKKLIFWSLVVLIVAVVVGYYFIKLKPVPPSQNFTNITNQGNIEDFRQSLIESRNLSVVMNITDAPVDKYFYVIRCGVNYAQSWGSVLREGFNESLIGHLNNYIVNGSSCTSSEIGGNVTERDISECSAEYGTAPYLLIHYGSSFAVFYKSHAEIFVDETSYPSCFMAINTGEENQTINQTVGNVTNST